MLWFHQDDAAVDAGPDQSEDANDDVHSVEDEKVQEVEEDAGDGVSRSERKVSHSWSQFCVIKV
jgi:hypothetical protein